MSFLQNNAQTSSYHKGYKMPLSLPRQHSQGSKGHKKCHMVQCDWNAEGWEERRWNHTYRCCRPQTSSQESYALPEAWVCFKQASTMTNQMFWKEYSRYSAFIIKGKYRCWNVHRLPNLAQKRLQKPCPVSLFLFAFGCCNKYHEKKQTNKPKTTWGEKDLF